MLAGEFLVHGAVGRCWRDSFPQSAAMALLLTRTRHWQDLFSNVTRFVAISEAQRRIHMEMGIPGEKIDVVHHFLDIPDDHVIPRFPPEGHALFIKTFPKKVSTDCCVHGHSCQASANW